jgi:archaellum component FlaC
MNDTDKITYLEEWVERLATDLSRVRGAYRYQTKCSDELTERVKQLETELADAKAIISP